MSTIKIIKSKNERRTLTRAEQWAELDKTAKASDLPDYHFDNVARMLEIPPDEYVMPTLLPLLVKTVLQRAVAHTTTDEKRYSVELQASRAVRATDDRDQPRVFAEGETMRVTGVHVMYTDQAIRLHRWLSEEYGAQDYINSGYWSIYGTPPAFVAEMLTEPPKPLHVEFRNEKTAIQACVNIINQYNIIVSRLQVAYIAVLAGTRVVPAPRVVVKPPADQVNADAVVKLLQRIHPYAVSLTHQTTFIDDIYSAGIEPIYWLGRARGLSYAYVQSLVSARERANEIMLERRRKTAETYSRSLFLTIQDYIAFKKFGKVYRQLDAKEQELATAERKSFDRLYMNDIDYPDYYTDLWSDEQAVRVSALKSLRAHDRKATSGKTKLGDLVCPHVLAKVEAETKRVPERQLREQLIADYSTPTPIRNYYYCKLCGEEIAVVYQEAELNWSSRNTGEDLGETEQLAWTTASNILSQYVEFRVMPNMRDIVRSIVANIMPYITEHESKLYKIRTNTKAKVEATLRLYIKIYVFASLIQFAVAHPNVMRLRASVRGTTGKKPHPDKNNKEDKKEQEDEKSSSDKEQEQQPMEIETSKPDKSAPAKKPSKLSAQPAKKRTKGGKADVRELFKTALGIISIITNVDMSTSGLTFDAVKQIFTVAFKRVSAIEVPTVTDVKDDTVIVHLASDPIYAFLHNTQEIAQGKQIEYTDAESVLGRSVKAIVSDGNVYNDIPPLKDAKKISPLRTAVYNKLREYLTGISTIPAVPQAVQLQQFYEAEDREIGALQRAHTNRMLVSNSSAVRPMLYKGGRGYTYRHGDLSLLYEPDGLRAHWDTYVFRVGSKTVKHTARELAKLVGTPERSKMVLVDRLASRTGTLMSKRKLGPVVRRLQQLEELRAFYNYYQFRCPKSGTHEFDKDKCKKCGVTKEMLTRQDVRYFERYAKQFTNVVSFGDNVKIVDPTPTPREVRPLPKPNTGAIASLAKLHKVEYNVLINLGLSEGVEWKSIVDKSANPSNDVQYNVRILRVLDYYRSIVANYTLVKNATGASQIPPHLQEIVKPGVSDLPALEPLDVGAYLHAEASTPALATYVIGTMCEQLLRPKKVGEKIIGAELQRIIDYDQMFSQYSQEIVRKTDTSSYAEGASTVIDTDETWDDDAPENEMEGDFDWDEAWDDNIEGDQSF